jgi:hypothetical protein
MLSIKIGIWWFLADMSDHELFSRYLLDITGDPGVSFIEINGSKISIVQLTTSSTVGEISHCT